MMSNYRIKMRLASISLIALLLFSTTNVLAADQINSTKEPENNSIEQKIPDSPESVSPGLEETSQPDASNNQNSSNSDGQQVEAIASENNANLSGDGDDGAEVIASTTTDINVNDDTAIENGIEFGLTTGQNTIGNNTVIDGLETGNIDGTINLLNLGDSILGAGSTFSSQNLLGGDQDITLFGGQGIDISGYGGGSGAGNTDILGNNNVVHIFEQGNSQVDNSIDIVADTGDNNVNDNTKIDNITTGDINLGVNLINLLDVFAPNLQLTVDVWNILGDFSGDITLGSSGTGSNSTDSNEASIGNNVDIDSIHNSDINNYFDLSMNTAENDLGDNTLVGDISTGNASARSNISNLSQVNSPMFYLLNVFGDWDGDYGGLDPNYTIVNVINENTAPDSTNVDVVGADNSLSIESETNSSVNNAINISANTGRNQIRRNTIVGGLATGDIQVAENVVNLLNSFNRNLTKFRLGIINIFGSWKHKSAGGDGGGGGNEPGPTTNPITENTQPDNSVLGVQRTNNNNLQILPAAGSDVPTSTYSNPPDASRQADAPLRTPIWGLIAMLLLSVGSLFGITLAFKKSIYSQK